MITIYKYQFELAPEIKIEMPSGSQILCVQKQNGEWTMWVKVNNELPLIERIFKAYWTGEPLPDMFLTHLYIATVQDYYVWHIFEQINQLNPAKGAVNYNMNTILDPGTKQEEQAAGEAVATENAQESAALDTAMDATQDAEEGSTEG